jgi:hypothetical protein
MSADMAAVCASLQRRLARCSDRLDAPDSFTASEHPMPAPGVREEAMVLLRYKVNGSAEMTDTSLARMFHQSATG